MAKETRVKAGESSDESRIKERKKKKTYEGLVNKPITDQMSNEMYGRERGPTDEVSSRRAWHAADWSGGGAGSRREPRSRGGVGMV